MIYFTSDQHYGHKNILKYCPMRVYSSVHQMNKALQNEYNSIVGDSDSVFMVGDFSLDKNPEVIESYLKELNGEKHLILGNHDLLKPFQYVDCGFTSVHTSLNIENIIIAHDPSTAVALPEGSSLIHGHVHQLWKNKMALNGVKLYNVGVDVHDMKPVSFDEIKRVLDYTT